MTTGAAGGTAAPSALSTGSFAAARAEFEAILAGADTAETHEVLAALCLTLEDLEAARNHAEVAYRRYKEEGNWARAGAAAMIVVGVHSWSGNQAAIRGWLGRARRILDQAGDCVERGYLEVARIGCEIHDVTALQASADAALDVARRFGDTDLEVRALADSGLALVCQGLVTEGLARLDEAMAAVVSGDIRNYFIAGTSCCAMLHACDRLGDHERAAEWTEAVFTSARARFGDPPPVVLQSHCRIIYGSLLAQQGRWEEAETEFARALNGTLALHYRADASARLADLSIRRGRLTEAADRLAGYEDCLEVAEVLARLNLAHAEPDHAEAILRRALREVSTDALSSAPLLGLLADVGLARGRPDAAAATAGELRAIAETTQVTAVWVLSELSDGRVAAATGGDAATRYRAALARLSGDQRPVLRADIQLELAGALRQSDPAAAVAECRSALAIFERAGAAQAAGRTAALLRSLGVTTRSRPGVTNDAGLSRREREVLELLREGLSNAEIGGRLFITPKTAEHHVSAILGKLNMRTRAEAAVFAESAKDR